MRRLTSPVLVLAVCLAALPFSARAQPSTACNDERATCRDTCNIEFGSSVTRQVQLRRCLEGCQSTHQRCSERWRELRSVDITPPPSRPAPEPMYDAPPAPLPEGEVEVESGSEPLRGSAASETLAAPAPQAEPSTRTRYADPAPQAEPERAPSRAEPPSRVVDADYNEGISLPSDEALGLEPAVVPAAARSRKAAPEKPAARREAQEPAAKKKTAHPELPPDPEYDISDWDPGD